MHRITHKLISAHLRSKVRSSIGTFTISNSYILLSYLNLAGYTLLDETGLVNVSVDDNREECNIGDSRLSG